MSFQIPESLLIQLRARREEARRGPANQHTLAKEDVVGKRNFSESLRRLFSGRVSVAAVANDYVQNMDNWQEEIEVAHDAFLLDPGMGPMVYLTSDGRILADSRGWDGDALVELTGSDANAALVVGASKTGIAGLLNLIPPRPADGIVCPNCNGTRTAEPVKGFGLEFACNTCGSSGWIPAL